MTKISNQSLRQAKKELILDNARSVFCAKGFASVTMKDIIDACSISRGGIYLYYASVEEIFKSVVLSREQRKFEGIRDSILKDIPYSNLVNDYCTTQKERLQNMDDSLLRAMYEYHFTHKEADDIIFREKQIESTRKTIDAMIELGLKQKCITSSDPESLRNHVMFLIEGLSVYALLGGLTDAIIDEQLTLIRALLMEELLK